MTTNSESSPTFLSDEHTITKKSIKERLRDVNAVSATGLTLLSLAGGISIYDLGTHNTRAQAVIQKGLADLDQQMPPLASREINNAEWLVKNPLATGPVEWNAALATLGYNADRSERRERIQTTETPLFPSPVKDVAPAILGGVLVFKGSKISKTK